MMIAQSLEPAKPKIEYQKATGTNAAAPLVADDTTISSMEEIRASQDAINDRLLKIQNSVDALLFGSPEQRPAHSSDSPATAILNPAQEKNQQTQGTPTNTLLVRVYDMLYPITIDVLRAIFSPHGLLDRVEIINKFPRFQALVRFQCPGKAAAARHLLQGRNVYDFCCQLDIQFMEPGMGFITADLNGNSLEYSAQILKLENKPWLPTYVNFNPLGSGVRHTKLVDVLGREQAEPQKDVGIVDIVAADLEANEPEIETQEQDVQVLAPKSTQSAALDEVFSGNQLLKTESECVNEVNSDLVSNEQPIDLENDAFVQLERKGCEIFASYFVVHMLFDKMRQLGALELFNLIEVKAQQLLNCEKISKENCVCNDGVETRVGASMVIENFLLLFDPGGNALQILKGNTMCNLIIVPQISYVSSKFASSFVYDQGKNVTGIIGIIIPYSMIKLLVWEKHFRGAKIVNSSAGQWALFFKSENGFIKKMMFVSNFQETLDLLGCYKGISTFIGKKESTEYKHVIRQHLDAKIQQKGLKDGLHFDGTLKFTRELLFIIDNALSFLKNKSSEYVVSTESRQPITKQRTRLNSATNSSKNDKVSSAAYFSKNEKVPRPNLPFLSKKTLSDSFFLNAKKTGKSPNNNSGGSSDHKKIEFVQFVFDPGGSTK